MQELLQSILTRRGLKTPKARQQVVLTELVKIGENIKDALGRGTFVVTTQQVVEEFLLCDECGEASITGVRCHKKLRNDDSYCHTICYQHIMEACNGTDEELYCNRGHAKRDHLIGPYFSEWLPNQLNALMLIACGMYKCTTCELFVPVCDYKTHNDKDIAREEDKEKRKAERSTSKASSDTYNRQQLAQQVVDARTYLAEQMKKTEEVREQKEKEIKELKTKYKIMKATREKEQLEKLEKIQSEYQKARAQYEQINEKYGATKIEVEKKQRDRRSESKTLGRREVTSK